MRRNRPARIAKFLVIAVIALPLFGLLVMSLWNWLMPALFAMPRITLLQALGMFLLARILFGGFGGNGGRRHRNMMARWEQMTPEERERFRAGMEHWKENSGVSNRA